MSRDPPAIDLANSYRSLVGEKPWRRLHPAIRRRFSAEYCHSAVTYTGVMQEIKLSLAGKILAHLCRLIGTPLALYAGRNVPITVNVYPNRKLAGMTWDRLYHYPHKPTNRVKSTKCIRNSHGLVELVGYGFGMNLTIYEQEGALCFESTRFFCQLGKFTIPIPDIVTPGKTLVTQRALDDNKFEFTLDVKHPLLGKVFYQRGTFYELQTEADCIL